MGVALTPNAFLNRTASTAWDVYFSYCGWRRIDTDRGEYTILTSLSNAFISGGFQFTADPSRRLVVFDWSDGADLLGGTGPILAVGTWYFFGLTTIAADVPDNVEVYYAAEGAGSLTQVTGSYDGSYLYTQHGVGWRTGADGADGAFRLHGSAYGDRTWQNTTLTPAEMLAEFQSATAVKTSGLWSEWRMVDATNATVDSSGNGRPLSSTTGTGTITTTDDPTFAATVDGTAEAAWGAWTADAAGTVEVSVTNGTSNTDWGVWDAFAVGETEGAFVDGTADTDWGAWNAFANGEVVAVVVDGTASASWTPWDATALGEVTAEVSATADATWGPWTATATGEVTETKVDLTIFVGTSRTPDLVGATYLSNSAGPTVINRGA